MVIMLLGKRRILCRKREKFTRKKKEIEGFIEEKKEKKENKNFEFFFFLGLRKNRGSSSLSFESRSLSL